MSTEWKAFLVPFFRKRCKIVTDGGEVVFYAFDVEKDSAGVESLIDDYIGSEKSLVEQLQKQLGLAREDAVMFGVSGGLEDCDVDGKPLEELLEDDVSQVETVLFYNPRTGDAYINNEGTFDKLPSRKKPTTLDKLGISLASGDEDEDD